MGLNETKLNSSIGDDEISIEGYSLVRKIGIRTVEVWRCTCIIILPFIKRLDLACELESIFIEVKLPFMKPFSITALYLVYLLRSLILLITCSTDLMMKTRNASQSET